jgi:hypothetical protein
MFEVSLYFSEDYVDLDVRVRGFISEAIAKKFADADARLILSPTGLELIVDGIQGSIDRNSVDIKLDTKWASRTPLDPSKPENLAKIQQALVDRENNIDNPLNIKLEDYELVDWSFAETFRKFNCTKDKLPITECIAYGIEEIEDSDIDEIAIEWMALLK